MALREEMQRQGSWLFKWRSYLPLLALPLFVVAIRDFEILERIWGDTVGDTWETVSFIIVFLGLAMRCLVAGYVPRGTSGRNTRTQAAETLNTTGIYSITRNPLYLGNFLIVVGITLFLQVWWLALIIWAAFWIYYERIIFTEEEFLRTKFGQEFLSWAEKTPIIWPRFRGWKSPSMAFSFRTVLRREFSTYMAIAATLFFLELAGTIMEENKFAVTLSWQIFFGASLVFYGVLVFLKKKTHLLDVPGR